MRHPIVDAVPLESLISTFASLSQALCRVRRHTPLRISAAYAKVGLCLAKQILHNIGSERWSVAGPCPLKEHMYPIKDRPLFRNTEDHAIVYYIEVASRTGLRSKILCAHGLANAAIVAMSHWAQHIHRGHVHRLQSAALAPLPWHGPFGNSILPRPPSGIPFLNLMRLPAPFPSSEGADEAALTTCHLEAMTTPAFFADDEWVGYQFSSDARRDSALHQMHFDAREVGKSMAVGITARPGEGSRPLPHDRSDAPGSVKLLSHTAFRRSRMILVGTVCRTSGWVHLQKQYSGCVVWHYAGVMTPFGIVGTWGETITGDEGPGLWGQKEMKGWFWLFKKSWTRPWGEEAG